jgi:hypothetical protein
MNIKRDYPSLPPHTIYQLDVFVPMELSIVDLSAGSPNFSFSNRPEASQLVLNGLN